MRPVLTAACHDMMKWEASGRRGREREGGRGKERGKERECCQSSVSALSKLLAILNFFKGNTTFAQSPLRLRFFWSCNFLMERMNFPQLFHAILLTLFLRCKTLTILFILNIPSIDRSQALSLTMSLSGLAPSSVVQLLPVGR